MGCKVSVSDTKPGLSRVAFQLIQAVVSIALYSPSSLSVGDSSERVGYNVKVGADMTSQVLEIIAGVDYDCNLLRREYVCESLQEACGPDAPGEACDGTKHAATPAKASRPEWSAS